MRVAIVSEQFDPYRELAAHQAAALTPGSYGACAHFVGVMRGGEAQEMTLEHYPEMTQPHLEQLARQAVAEWGLLDVLVLHRVGTLRPGDPIVLVASWSAHRKEAFGACRQLMEALKSEAPFWKKEHTASGDRWVEENTPGE